MFSSLGHLSTLHMFSMSKPLRSSGIRTRFTLRLSQFCLMLKSLIFSNVLNTFYYICKKDNTSLLYLTRWHPGEDELVSVNHMHCWLNVIVTTKRNSEFRHFILHGNKKKIAQGNKILNIFPPNVFFILKSTTKFQLIHSHSSNKPYKVLPSAGHRDRRFAMVT